MSIVLDGTTGITTPDVSVTAQSSDIVTSGNIEAVNATLSGSVYLGGASAANALDDYEEGTWTPTGNGVTFDSGSYGYYVKVGKLVTLVCHIDMPVTTNSNTFFIYGIPFAPDNSILGGQTYKSGGSLGYTTHNFASAFVCSMYSSDRITLRNPLSSFDNNAFSGEIIRFQINYYAA